MRCAIPIWTNANKAVFGPWTVAEQTSHQARRNTLAANGGAALHREPFHPRFAKRFPASIREILTRDADRCDLPSWRFWTTQLRICRFAKTLPRDGAAQILPEMQIVDLEGGHSINIEAPLAFNAAVFGFLSAFSARGTRRLLKKPVLGSFFRNMTHPSRSNVGLMSFHADEASDSLFSCVGSAARIPARHLLWKIRDVAVGIRL